MENLSYASDQVTLPHNISEDLSGHEYNVSSHKRDGKIIQTRTTSISKGDLLIESVDPHLLKQEDFMRIQEINQDMWARGLGEFLECKNCHHIASKEDIFGEGKLGISIDLYKKSVRKIMHTLDCHSFSCPHCSGAMDEIYGAEYVNDIKSRLLENQSYLTVCRFKGKIVGFMDFFSTTLYDSYMRDWERHYKNIGFPEIEARVHKILGYTPDEVFCFTAMGLLEEYNNFFTIFQILNIAFQSVPEEYSFRPGISELDRNNNLYGMYRIIGGESLGISDDKTLRSKITNTKSSYLSDLTLFMNPVETGKKNFSIGIRKFLRQYGPGLNIA